MAYLENPSSKSYARSAGALYLTIAVAGGISIAYIPSQIQIAGDSAATVANLLTKTGLLQIGLLCSTIVLLAEIMLSAMLYFMFKPMNDTLSLMAAFARVMMVAVMACMLFFQIGALSLADPGGAMSVMPEAVRIEWVALMLYLHDAGVWIWQIFFALHLWLLGYLVTRSGVYSRLLGYGLIFGGTGYLLDSIYAFVFPEAAILGGVRAAMLAVVVLAEIGFALILVIKGTAPRASGR